MSNRFAVVAFGAVAIVAITATLMIPPSKPPPADREPGAIQDQPDRVFALDATGRVIIDEQTRVNMEAFYARYGGDGLENAKDEMRRSLPPEAAAEAIDLVERFGNYLAAVRQTYPPGAAPPAENHAKDELEGLHALRVAHFGEKVANALYGRAQPSNR